MTPKKRQKSVESGPMEPAARKLRERIAIVIFEADTPAGKAFDVVLLWAIVVSSLVVVLESVEVLARRFGLLFRWSELVLTGLFTVEYVLRLYSARRPARYATSFFGVVDLLSILPTWLSLILPGAQALTTIRTLRLLRVFRVLKLARYLTEAQFLLTALRASRAKIFIFLFAVGVLVTFTGSLMYLIEGSESGFTSIPRSMYWAVVTLTTVGYGDIAPQTVLGQSLASLLMVAGFGIIAVPTGIVTVEMVQARRREKGHAHACPNCTAEHHDADARYCKYCGHGLHPKVDE